MPVGSASNAELARSPDAFSWRGHRQSRCDGRRRLL